MDWTLEVVVLPVRDIDASVAFYLDHDTKTDQMHVVQLTPRGSGCSIVFSPDDGGTFFGFRDPDGNTWAVQQLKVRGEKQLIRKEDRGRFGA
jgi:catechol 2,3-dioxygenase-like lactoylglutathione lyase family enzyme